MTDRDRSYDEAPCVDCAEGRHEDCRRAGGFPHTDSAWDERCVCHVLRLHPDHEPTR